MIWHLVAECKWNNMQYLVHAIDCVLFHHSNSKKDKPNSSFLFASNLVHVHVHVYSNSKK